jgi:hypothetical protein
MFAKENRNGRVKIAIVILLLTELVFLLMEAKTEMLILPIWFMLLIALTKLNQKEPIITKFTLSLFVVLIAIICWSLLPTFQPSWVFLRNESMFNTVSNRFNISVNSTARYINAVKSMNVQNYWQNIIGIGMGSSLPPEKENLIFMSGLALDNFEHIFQFSKIYQKYQTPLSVFSCLLIDCGVLGAILYLVILWSLFKSARFLLKNHKNYFQVTIGAIGVWQSIILLYRSYAGNILIYYLPIAVTSVIFGVIKYECSKLRSE